MFTSQEQVTVRIRTGPPTVAGGMHIPKQFQGKMSCGEVICAPASLVAFIGRTLAWLNEKIVADDYAETFISPIEVIRTEINGRKFAEFDPNQPGVFVIVT